MLALPCLFRLWSLAFELTWSDWQTRWSTHDVLLSVLDEIKRFIRSVSLLPTLISQLAPCKRRKLYYSRVALCALWVKYLSRSRSSDASFILSVSIVKPCIGVDMERLPDSSWHYSVEQDVAVWSQKKKQLGESSLQNSLESLRWERINASSIDLDFAKTTSTQTNYSSESFPAHAKDVCAASHLVTVFSPNFA